MKLTIVLTALAGASLIASGTALAQGRGGGQGQGQGQGQSGAGVGVGTNAGGGAGLGRSGADIGARGQMDRIDRTNTGVETRANARVRSQGPANASPRAIERADENSVLSGATVPDLSALAPDTVIVNADGDTVGTVSRITRSGDRVRNVFVTTEDGRTLRLRAGTLRLENGSWVTTDTRLDDDD